MNRAHRFLLVAIALLLAGSVVAVAQHRGTPSAQPSAQPAPTIASSQGGPCLHAPARMPMPSFFPTNLPLPPGSYATQVPPAFAGSQRAVVIAKGSLRDVIGFILREWPKRGWVMGRGDAEPGEADDSFRDRSAVTYGAFKARAIMCDASTTWVFFVFARGSSAPAPETTVGSATESP